MRRSAETVLKRSRWLRRSTILEGLHRQRPDGHPASDDPRPAGQYRVLARPRGVSSWPLACRHCSIACSREREAKAKGRISEVLSPGPSSHFIVLSLVERGGSGLHSAAQGWLSSRGPP